MTTYRHIPVMPREVMEHLNCRPGKIYVDCTLGGSGHAREICEKIAPGGVLIGIDQDMDAVKNAATVLKDFKQGVRLFHDNFVNLPEILSGLRISGVDGVLLDLGISLHHFESSGRGFSFSRDEPLDMRMDTRDDTTAAHIVNRMGEADLAAIFKKYGEEPRARSISRKIITARKQKPVTSSKQLAGIVCAAAPGRVSGRRKIHPATRVFMALRIAVNSELERLEAFMENVPALLNPEARLCALSFHSLEDRIVKQKFKALEKGCSCPPSLPCVCNKKPVIRVLTRKVQKPTEAEIASNPMARSARLRAMEKI
ncbi:MAG: 16S rRNA (cytosine(1402)-N(4))-methyltransferase RsmH [Desulfobacterales bacterium]|nr:16S rRNA (cytosine(1402)-N(4))-methyltransferase RsmH [Desulfobacterales bacterium]